MPDNIGTEALPDKIVNEEFVLFITNMVTDPEERIGRTHLWRQDAMFDEEEQPTYLESWDNLATMSADQIEFSLALLRYWADRFDAVLKSKRAAERRRN